jgi:SAM-dependent methyltransferase
MGNNRTVVVNNYDYPRYYDIAFQAYTRMEVDFIEAACRKHCTRKVHRLLEPACGTGRLVTELAARGYSMIGFDLNERTLSYLRRRLTRRRLRAEIFKADMADFRLGQRIDAAYCTVSTFRHLLTEQAARAHLKSVAKSLAPGGIYILGLHLLQSDGKEPKIPPWKERRAATEVVVTLRTLRTDRRRRLQDSRIDLLVRKGRRQLRLQHQLRVRTYTEKQLRCLLDSVSSLELCDTYDFRYNIEEPMTRSDELVYGLFVLRRRASR